jgi:hypothetical protein
LYRVKEKALAKPTWSAGKLLSLYVHIAVLLEKIILTATLRSQAG